MLIKALRGRRAGPVAKRVAAVAGDHFGVVTSGVRVGLAAANALHGLVGTGVMKASLDGMRAFSGGRLPKWSPALPRAVNFRPRRGGHSRSSERVVYFPSCAARNMGAQRGDEEIEALPVVAERLFAKAGFEVVYPERLGRVVLRPAVREQGALRGGRSQVGGTRGRLARRQRKRTASHCVRHESVHLPDEAIPRRAACSAGRHRVRPRFRPATGPNRGDRRASGDSPGVQSCARWARSTSSRRSQRAAAVTWCR